ncbi:MAG: PAS domain-containing protein [Holophagaceae bacterium]|uniref:PAS domain-containing protein n=1 Tax=Candidatus Geothrix odensensis TaxID=2954440 RepID=A0A936K6N4_9BACT|nr:PAS domain-containing protein [Candidatus Geothrix odensensis]
MPDLPQKWRDVHQKALAGVISSADSDEWVRADGTVEWTRWECRPWYEADGSIGGIIVYTELISERKRAQAVLLVSEEKYRTLIDNLSTGLVVHGPDSSILLANGMASALLGLSKEQMLGKTAVDPEWRFLQEDGSPLPLEGYPVNRVLASGEGFKGLVIGVCRPDRATPTWLLGNAYPVKDAAGQIAEVVITFGDITALKQAEAALRESEERWKFAIEGAGDGLWTGMSRPARLTTRRATRKCSGMPRPTSEPRRKNGASAFTPTMRPACLQHCSRIWRAGLAA